MYFLLYISQWKRSRGLVICNIWRQISKSRMKINLNLFCISLAYLYLCSRNQNILGLWHHLHWTTYGRTSKDYHSSGKTASGWPTSFWNLWQMIKKPPGKRRMWRKHWPVRLTRWKQPGVEKPRWWLRRNSWKGWKRCTCADTDYACERRCWRDTTDYLR